MRKVQKQQAEDFVRTLEEAHGEIRKYIDRGNLNVAMDLLGQCQEGAIQLGSLIESTEGEGFITVTKLEEYCELLYHTYESLQQGQAQSGNKVSKLLGKSLTAVGNSVRNDIPIRSVAVFLPYKASMWDSLESVWKAADEDDGCDAYVIPIPYYDRNPDGSMGKMHYEGELFPEGIPVTHYEKYDFANSRPDMIFIHNPYDDCNIVTSVHPFFYSKNMKQYTDKLIYIPYFVLAEIDPQNRRAVENMKHFCMTPGVVNADKVVVQSEDMRTIYIDVLTEAYGEETREYWEEKILGIGSPKMDKALSTSSRDVKLPADWENCIKKPDGSLKKIVFYNTSIGALLEHDVKMLKKMKSVFGIFKEKQEEVTLLWRPHPLIEATIESMKPELREEYTALVRWYKEESIGIYDDTADLNRAIAISDAYYGDHSSVVQLCKEAGIPVMIQNVDILDS